MQHQSQIDKHSELRSISVRLDGRASIEHQIDIHVQVETHSLSLQLTQFITKQFNTASYHIISYH